MFATRCALGALAPQSSPLSLPFVPLSLVTAKCEALSHPNLFSAQRKSDDEALSRAIELIKSRPPLTTEEIAKGLIEALTGLKDDKGVEQSPVELARSLLQHIDKKMRR